MNASNDGKRTLTIQPYWWILNNLPAPWRIRANRLLLAAGMKEILYISVMPSCLGFGCFESVRFLFKVGTQCLHLEQQRRTFQWQACLSHSAHTAVPGNSRWNPAGGAKWFILRTWGAFLAWPGVCFPRRTLSGRDFCHRSTQDWTLNLRDGVQQRLCVFDILTSVWRQVCLRMNPTSPWIGLLLVNKAKKSFKCRLPLTRIARSCSSIDYPFHVWSSVNNVQSSLCCAPLSDFEQIVETVAKTNISGAARRLRPHTANTQPDDLTLLKEFIKLCFRKKE